MKHEICKMYCVKHTIYNEYCVICKNVQCNTQYAIGNISEYVIRNVSWVMSISHTSYFINISYVTFHMAIDIYVISHTAYVNTPYVICSVKVSTVVIFHMAIHTSKYVIRNLFCKILNRRHISYGNWQKSHGIRKYVIRNLFCEILNRKPLSSSI